MSEDGWKNPATRGIGWWLLALFVAGMAVVYWASGRVDRTRQACEAQAGYVYVARDGVCVQGYRP